MTDEPAQNTSANTPASSTRARGRTTTLGVRIADATARIGITAGGIGVIFAVLAIMAYLFVSVVPLFKQGKVEKLVAHTMPAPASAGVTNTPPPGATLPSAANAPVAFALVDEYLGTVQLVATDGRRSLIKVDTGKVTDLDPIGVPGQAITAIASPADAATAGEPMKFAIGYHDGNVQIGSVGYKSTYLDDADATPEMKALQPGQRLELVGDKGPGFVDMTGTRQLRVTRPIAELAPPVKLSEGEGPVIKLEYRASPASEYLLALRADGTMIFSSVRVTRPLGGGKPRTSLSSESIKLTPPAGAGGPPVWLVLTGEGSSIVAFWPQGVMQRYARLGAGDDASFQAVESRTITTGTALISSVSTLLGAKTIIVGDTSGRVQGLFVSKVEQAKGLDGKELVTAHDMPSEKGNAIITSIARSTRDRSFAVGDATGQLFVRNMTSQKLVAQIDTGFGAPIAALSVAPKFDAVVAIAAPVNNKPVQVGLWSIEPGHPSITTGALLGKVWYENEPAPSYVYQSSSGEDTAEVKLSMVPLIFGTIKATIYALLFAVPVAILAAIYTSELLHPKVRLTVKPVIEMMASMPSVVLGFVAALVIAPLARDHVPSILLAFWIVPMGALLAGYLWQLLPIRVSARVRPSRQMFLVLGVLLLGLLAAFVISKPIERALFSPKPSEVLILAGAQEPVPEGEIPAWAKGRKEFSAPELRQLAVSSIYMRSGQLVRPAGNVADPKVAARISADQLDRPDIRKWLDGTIGTAWPGWMLVMTPAATIIVFLLRGRLVDRALHAMPISARPGAAGWLEFGKFAASTICSLALAAALAAALTSMGFDARDSVLGSFSQRNTLIVGIVMGFAIIPIIYTISEDAMSAVPGALRSASLGCGATKWQTATRVVLPMALSGIFSACMIGLGRAAGETMIVLMATGNTPNMDWNIFSGFRTLAANIATELPEADVGGTHYRVLFLGALMLFVITFIVNTLAEIVRQRVRAKGAGL
jgi:phosphate transport system permease protein